MAKVKLRLRNLHLRPKGAAGRAAVRAVGQKETTGHFAQIEAARGKGAAIAAYQNKLKATKVKARRKRAVKAK